MLVRPAMHMLPRSLGSLLFTSLIAVAAGCATETADVELRVAVHAETDRAWVLTGPADGAEALADQLSAALSADGMIEGDATAAITRDETVIEVALDPSTTSRASRRSPPITASSPRPRHRRPR